MTNKNIAKRLRDMADRQEKVLGFSSWSTEIRQVADELDPPRPESDTVVWWRYKNNPLSRWQLGIAGPSGVDQFGTTHYVAWSEIEYKPARILADDEVAVKILPVQDWPRRCDEISLRWNYHPIDKNMQAYAGVTITRAEAEEREAKQ